MTTNTSTTKQTTEIKILDKFVKKKSATADASRRAASKFAYTNYANLNDEERNNVSNALVRIKNSTINVRPLTDEEISLIITYASDHGFEQQRTLEAPKIITSIINKISKGDLDIPSTAEELNQKLQQKLPFSEEDFFVMLVLFILSNMQKQLPGIRQLPSGIRGLPPRQQESKSGFNNKILENYNYFYNCWKTFLKG